MHTLSRLLGRTQAYDEFCELAHPYQQLWRLIAGVLTAGAAFLVLMTVGSLAGYFLWPDVGAEISNMSSSTGLLVALGTFFAWAPAIAIALAIWHRRSLLSVLNIQRRIILGSYGMGFLIAAAIGLVTVLIGAALVGMPTPSVRADSWILPAMAAFVFLLVQTGSEELLFRGYLQQQLGARFRSGIWWGILPSVLFGLLHWNPEGAGGGAGIIVLTTGLFGLTMAVIVARTGDLSLVMGLHMGVNTVALLLVSPSDYLSGLALLEWPPDAQSLRILGWLDFAVLSVVSLAALFWDQRRRDLSILPDVFS